MRCPFCHTDATRVVDSRLAAEGSQVRRRRECPACASRFTTFENAELTLPRILKNDGSPEEFDKRKMRQGMERALYKRPPSAETIDAAVERVIQRLRTAGEREVRSRSLGTWVMEELRELDQVAYVRFASVYRRFEDVNAFREEVERLQATPDRATAAAQLPLIEPAPGAADRGKAGGGKP